MAGFLNSPHPVPVTTNGTPESKAELAKTRKRSFEFQEQDLEKQKFLSKKTKLSKPLNATVSFKGPSRDTEHEELKTKYFQLVKELRDRASCPVCLCLPTVGPVYQCPHGHMVCRDCKGKTCPTCRAPMGDIKSLLAMTVIDNIDHACTNDGCSKLCTAKEMDTHKQSCSERLVICPAQSCKVSMALSNVERHINSSCIEVKNMMNVSTCVNKVKLNLFIKEGGKAKKSLGLNWQDKTFLFNVEPIARVGWHFFVQMLGTREECSRYEVGVKLLVVAGGSSRIRREFGRSSFRGQPMMTEEVENRYSTGIVVASKVNKSVKLEATIDFSMKKTVSHNIGKDFLNWRVSEDFDEDSDEDFFSDESEEI